MTYKLYIILEFLGGERGIKLLPYRLTQRLKMKLLETYNTSADGEHEKQ